MSELIEPRSKNKESIMLCLSVVIGYLFNDLILFNGIGVGVTIFVIVFYSILFWYFKQRDNRLSIGWDLFIPIILLSLTFTLFNNYFLLFLNLILMYFLMVIHITQLNGNLLNRKYSVFMIIDYIQTAILLPLINIPDTFNKVGKTAGKNKSSKKGIFIILGLIISIPIALMTIGVLMSADAAFEGLVNKLFDIINRIKISQYFFEIFLGIVFAIPVFGVLSALKHKKINKSMRIRENMSVLRRIDNTVINTVLIVLNIIYLVYIVAQFGYFFNAFSSILPDGFSFSEYARRGFFELQVLEVINLFIVLFVYIFSKRFYDKAYLTKVLNTSIIVYTLLILSSAVAKMIIYVNQYGLTLLRVYTTWFMLLTCLIFIFLLVKQFVKRFAFIKWSAITFIILFLGLNYINVDYMIPSYNVQMYREGKLKIVDIQMFDQLSDSMVPAVIPLLDDRGLIISENNEYNGEQRINEIRYKNVRELLNDRDTHMTKWQRFNFAQYYADKLISEKLK